MVSVQVIGAGGSPLTKSVSFTLPNTPFYSSAAYEAQVLAGINAARASGYSCATGKNDGPRRPPLTRSAVLDRAALGQAIAMPVANFMDHTSALDGSTPDQRIRAAGYPNASTSENLAAGQPTPTEAVEGWKYSPTHCAALMGDYAETGVAYVKAPGSQYTHYWVQVFGRRAAP